MVGLVPPEVDQVPLIEWDGVPPSSTMLVLMVGLVPPEVDQVPLIEWDGVPPSAPKFGAIARKS